MIRSGELSGAMNMAADESIMIHVGKGLSAPTLRFYRWKPPTISVGYFQELEAELDTEACMRLGLGYVRRPTGGRAVLHDNEVTYSVIMPEGQSLIPEGVVDSYRVISVAILAGLAALGLHAEVVPVSAKRAGTVAPPAVPPEGARSSAACFDAPSWYEVVVSGRKLVGSAQTRRGGALLQHGSIPLEFDSERFFKALRFRSDDARLSARRRYQAKATSVIAELGRSLTIDEAEDAMVEGFRRTFGVALAPRGLSESEKAFATELVATRYGDEAWTRFGPGSKAELKVGSQG